MAGSSGGKSSDGKKKARIEIIPLIDVIFFLLATFVLFTLSLNKIQALDVNLPVANPNPAPKEEDESVTLQVSDAGTLYWNKELIQMSEVTPRLQNYIMQNPSTARVLISSDDRAKYGATITVLDEVRKAGIKQVSIETVWRATGK
ncbi:MAG TPA: biopolymer transporter ExbD [Opitutaceae bacterium]|nr:biopolymer transporter ExbD [Opitutaceae bacterium]